jgi:tripartite-type tricarboxylate transporter receptor subunit TctC
MRSLVLSLACALALLTSIPATGQISVGSSTSRTSILVGYAAGGGGDVIARLLQPELQKMVNQTVIVENLPGAGGIIAAKKLLSNPADGHTISFGGPIESVIAPETMPAATYKSQDFRPIVALVNSRTALLARPDIPVKDAAELITWAKSQNRSISYGSFGVGNIYHLFGEQFTKATGVNTLQVPYSGGAAPLRNGMADRQSSRRGSRRAALGGTA